MLANKGSDQAHAATGWDPAGTRERERVMAFPSDWTIAAVKSSAAKAGLAEELAVRRPPGREQHERARGRPPLGSSGGAVGPAAARPYLRRAALRLIFPIGRGWRG